VTQRRKGGLLKGEFREAAAHDSIKTDRDCFGWASVITFAQKNSRVIVIVKVDPLASCRDCNPCTSSKMGHLTRGVDREMGSTTAWEGKEMLTNASQLKGLVIRATDGEIGTVDQFYFDDESWSIRYLTVETGGWLGGREVLISPVSVIATDWQGKRLDVALTRKQVEDSPNIDTHRPVSRQDEARYLGYYGYPYYWGFYPIGLVDPNAKFNDELVADRIQRESTDSHLRSTEAVTGYRIEAADGEIGHVEGFVLDDANWAIRYMEVATKNWWPGKKVLVSPSWIRRVSWTDSTVYVGLSREAIQTGPKFDESAPITREYEDRLHAHYGLAPYWLHDARCESVLL
jgi:hypothetical protein